MVAGKARSKPFRGEFAVGTRSFYSNGNPHWAYDYLCPLGTPVLAPRSGVILDCNDGEPDSPEKRWSGMPSNWILLGYRNLLGQKRTVYMQHLQEGSLLVRKGDKVVAGQCIAKSGNSGNSTGPHLHFAVAKGWLTRASRYDYMVAASKRVWPPDLVWDPKSL